MTMFKVNLGPPNEVGGPRLEHRSRSRSLEIVGVILRVASWLVLCALKVRLLPSKVDNRNEVPTELTLAGHHI